MTDVAMATRNTVGGEPDAAPLLAQCTRERMQRAGHDLWRVIDTSGVVIGHVQARPDPRGVRFRARRYHAPSTAFRELGEFWSADEAVACLRYLL